MVALYVYRQLRQIRASAIDVTAGIDGVVYLQLERIAHLLQRPPWGQPLQRGAARLCLAGTAARVPLARWRASAV